MNNKEYIFLFEKYRDVDKIVEETGIGRATVITRCKRLKLYFEGIKYFKKRDLLKQKLIKGKYLERFAFPD